MTAYQICQAERRDLAALSALARAQAAARQSLDPRLPATPHIIPFLSQAETLADVLSSRHHITLVARRDGQVVGGSNLHRVEQSDRDQFAAYYPRRFTSIGLLVAQPGAPAGVLPDLLAAARDHASRWKSEALLAHNPAADHPFRAALEQFGFRMFYHYALCSPIPPARAPGIDSAAAAAVPLASKLDTATSDGSVRPGRPLEPNGHASASSQPDLVATLTSSDNTPAALILGDAQPILSTSSSLAVTTSPDDAPGSLAATSSPDTGRAALTFSQPPPDPDASTGASSAPVLLARTPQPERGVPVVRHTPPSVTLSSAAARQPAKAALDGLSVRHATSADLDAVVAIGLQSVRYHASLEAAMRVPRGEDSKMRRRFQEILREPQRGAIFVALLDWQIVGFYSLYLQTIDDSWTPPLFAPGRYGLIAEVAVAEGLRGRGIGHRLFNAVELWFRERGAQRLWLIYLPRNPLSSRFWPSLDFQPVWDVMLAPA